MLITPIGVIVLLAGAALFFNRRSLFHATVASFPFYFVVLLETPLVSIKPYQFLGALLVVRQLWEGKILLPRTTSSVPINRPSLFLLLFLTTVYASLAMPELMKDQIQVVSVDTAFLDYAYTEPLRLTSKNITQPLYLSFMVVLFYSLSRELRSLDDITKCLKINLVCGVTALSSGLAYQLGYLFVGQRFLSVYLWFFTGNSDAYAIEVNMLTDAFSALPRMFSLVGEAGYTGLFLAFAAALAIGSLMRPFKQEPALRVKMTLVFFLMIGVILTGSTTGLFCLVFLLAGMMAILPLRADRTSPAHRFTSLVASMVVVLVVFITGAWAASFMTGGDLSQHVTQKHWAKLALLEGSGAVRMRTIDFSIQDVFAQSPWLGVGYGSHRSSSMFAALLSNVGICGTVPFMLFNAVLVKRVLGILRRSPSPRQANLAFVLLAAFVCSFPMLLIGQGHTSLLFGWYWTMMAMMFALDRVSLQPIATTKPAPHDSPLAGLAHPHRILRPA